VGFGHCKFAVVLTRGQDVGEDLAGGRVARLDRRARRLGLELPTVGNARCGGSDGNVERPKYLLDFRSSTGGDFDAHVISSCPEMSGDV